MSKKSHYIKGSARPPAGNQNRTRNEWDGHGHPVIPMSYQTATVLGSALRDGGVGNCFMRPFSNGDGGVFSINNEDGTSEVGWYGSDFKILLGFTINSRDEALHWGDGLLSAAEAVRTSPGKNLVVPIRAPEVTITVADLVQPGDPLAATPEHMDRLLSQLHGGG